MTSPRSDRRWPAVLAAAVIALSLAVAPVAHAQDGAPDVQAPSAVLIE